VLEARDLFVTEAVLTGESLPVEKYPGSVVASAPLASRTNALYYGTSVRSGTATALVVNTGQATVYGGIASKLATQPPETEFERGLGQFGMLLVWFMIAMVLIVLSINLLLGRPVVETLLFALALAVGLSPELLPAILGITLTRGAHVMAKRGVIVKRLNAIENFGGMNVLCTDKTGTLTEGVMELSEALDALGNPSASVMQWAVLNASFQTGLVNPLDAAIIGKAQGLGVGSEPWRKLDEIPYDFLRKRLTIVVERADEAEALFITKGALRNVLEICTQVRLGGVEQPLDEPARQELERRFAAWSEQGYRVLGLASKRLASRPVYQREDECEMLFEGFLLFFDPPKAGVTETLAALRELGVRVKIITGDNALVARHVAIAVGIAAERVLTGAEIDASHDEALWHLVEQVDLFAEVDPNQKERILRALQKSGNVVGFLGDGINDAPALHAADVGISVDTAVDVAREAADFVLLEHNLEVLRQGIEEGRATFANTMKYIFVTTSANYGNMLSMTIASLFLPFLPLLAKQILLNNFLSDLPAMGIAADHVDREWGKMPHRWDMAAVRRFMVIFGLISMVFDLLTFAVLWWLVQADQELFRTGWFVESLLTELCILFVLRTYRPFYRSRPGRFLLLASIGVIVLTVALPYLSLGALFDFVPIPAGLLATIILITLLYVVVCEVVKQRLYHSVAAA
jgi:Mg2+-importing ATPase